MALKFHLCKTLVISGVGAFKDLPAEIKNVGVGKALIVTDYNLSKTTGFKMLLDTLESSKIAYAVYDGVTENPKDFEVMLGVEKYKEHKCSCVIGIGGGSSMDAAKSISAMVRHEGDIMDYGRSTPNRKYFTKGREPLVCIPTTSGTGSEVSPHAVITNTKIDRKSDVMESIFYPDIVVLEPQLTTSMPKKVTKDVGVDALVHIIESYTNKKMLNEYSPFHDAIALQGIKLISENFRQVVNGEGEDLKARENMMWASMIGGVMLDLDVGCIHGLTGVLQKYYHEMTHGESVGVMLPSGMKFNLESCPERFKNIAIAFGIDVSEMDEIEAAKASIEAVRALLHDIEFKKLSDFIKDEKEIDRFYMIGAGNSCLKNNPRSMTPEEVKKVYIDALKENW